MRVTTGAVVALLLPVTALFLLTGCGARAGRESVGVMKEARSPDAVRPGDSDLPAPGEELWVIQSDKSSDAPRTTDDAAPLRTTLDLNPPSGALFCRRDDRFVPVPLRHTDVAARVDGIVSSVTVVQKFHNPFDGKIEAHYVFPLPENSAVTGFVMTVGERRIRAVIREKAEAERIYLAARAAGLVAALLVQKRPNVFRQKVANIEPGKQIDVHIEYWNTVKRRDGWFEWVFPMVVGPRFNPPAAADPVDEVDYLAPGLRSGHDVRVAVEIDAGMPIDVVRSPSHEILAHPAETGRALITLKQHRAIPNKDLVLRWRTRGQDTRAAAFTAIRDGQEGGHLMLMVEAPPRANAGRPLDLVFLLDCSGSMNGEPFDQMMAAAHHAIDALGPEDTFQVVRFSSEAAVLGNGPLPATVENRRRVRGALRRTSSGGGTMMMRGLEAALGLPRHEERQRFYVLMTDGFIGNEEDVIERVGRGIGHARIFSFGIGSSPNRFLLERLARVGAGAVAYVGAGDDAVTTMDLFLDRVRTPALTQLEIDWGGLEVVDMQPSRLPELMSGRALIVSARFRGVASRPIRLRGRQGGVVRELEVPAVLDEGGDRPGNPDLGRLWARARIADLRSQAWCQLIGKAEASDLVRRIALDYGMLSPYTSFVAVDSKSRTAGDHGTSVQVPVPTPAGTRYSTHKDR